MELRYIRRRNGENFMQMHMNAGKVSQEPCLQYSAHGGKGKCSRLGVIEFPEMAHNRHTWPLALTSAPSLRQYITTRKLPSSVADARYLLASS